MQSETFNTQERYLFQFVGNTAGGLDNAFKASIAQTLRTRLNNIFSAYELKIALKLIEIMKSAHNLDDLRSRAIPQMEQIVSKLKPETGIKADYETEIDIKLAKYLIMESMKTIGCFG